MHPVVTGPVEYTGREMAEAELAAFRDALSAAGADPEETFMTAASPSVVTATHVDDYEEYLFAVADDGRGVRTRRRHRDDPPDRRPGTAHRRPHGGLRRRTPCRTAGRSSRASST